MTNAEEQEEKNKRVGWLVSVGVQLFLLVLFYFIVAWKAPFPPIPEYGIELGFIQSAGASLPAEASNPAEEAPAEEAEPNESDNVQETTTENQDENTEETEEVVDTVEDSETPEDIVEESSTTATEEGQEERVTEEVVSESTEEEQPADVVQEEEQPEIDERAIYGGQGSESGNEEGASLKLAGWMWDNEPDPDDTSEEAGKIIFEIVVDENGEIVKISTITSTVSPSVKKIYSDEVEKLTFSRNSPVPPAQFSTGTITFIIKTK